MKIYTGILPRQCEKKLVFIRRDILSRQHEQDNNEKGIYCQDSVSKEIMKGDILLRQSKQGG